MAPNIHYPKAHEKSHLCEPMEGLDILQCPITKQPLKRVTDQNVLDDALKGAGGVIKELNVDAAVTNHDETWLYPVVDGIFLLLPFYGIPLGGGARPDMSFDKERVFRYYNEIEYMTYESKTIYDDSAKWVDYRPVAREYIAKSFGRARQYLPKSGGYYLDVASGPIGLSEYLSLSDGFDCRVCVDISFRALQQAKQNYTDKALFVCGDITNLPLRDNVCDAVLSQHTLYHVPKDEQGTAVTEMYRVTAAGGRVGIVYNWFYHSWMMNLLLGPVQLYRVTRHFAGKLYVRLFNKKPRLYYYTHPPRYFKRLPFGDHVKFYSWRAANKHFLSLYAHSWLGGKKLLDWLMRKEETQSEFYGKHGEYPFIVIDKPK